MIKTDSKLHKACEQADKRSAKTGNRYTVSFNGRGDYVVELHTKPFFGWAVLYVTL